MSNIVPKNNEDGRLGRLERRWQEVHAQLASLESVRVSGKVAAPTANELHIDANGKLKLGDASVALSGDVDQLSALITAFFNEDPNQGVKNIIANFDATYDTLVELINGLNKLSDYATKVYVADELAALSLGSLTDVTLGTIAQGSVLKYDGASWSAGVDTTLSVKGNPQEIQIKDPLGDNKLHSAGVYIIGNNAGAALVREVGEVHGFVPRVSHLETEPAGTTLGSLTDVALGTLTPGGALVYDSVNAEWVAGTISIEGIKTSLANLVAGNGGLSQGAAGDIQTSDGNGSFLSSGVSVNNVLTGNTVTEINLGVSDADKTFSVTADRLTLGSTLTGTASTLSFGGEALATRSYVNSVAGSGVSVSGDAHQFEVSDGNGDLTPIGIYAKFTAAATLTSIIPEVDEKIDLGSPDLKFRTGYFSANSIFLGTSSLSITGSTLTAGGEAIAKANALNSLSTDVVNLNSTVSSQASSIGANSTGVATNAAQISSNASSITSLQTTVENIQLGADNNAIAGVLASDSSFQDSVASSSARVIGGSQDPSSGLYNWSTSTEVNTAFGNINELLANLAPKPAPYIGAELSPSSWVGIGDPSPWRLQWVHLHRSGHLNRREYMSPSRAPL